MAVTVKDSSPVSRPPQVMLASDASQLDSTYMGVQETAGVMRSFGAMMVGREPGVVGNTAQVEMERRAEQRRAAIARGELLVGERREDVERIEARLTAIEWGA